MKFQMKWATEMQSTVFKIIANWNYFPLVYVRNIVNEICYQKKKKKYWEIIQTIPNIS